MALTVVVHEKGGKTQRFPFDSDQFNVGREEDNHLLLDRANVSKHHLRFRRANGTIEVLDLGSTNGTYVNGRKVQDPKQVRRSDRIYVGDYILMLEGDDPSIAPRERAELPVATKDGGTRRAPVAIPGAARDREEPLPGLEDDSVLTSARRVAAPGMESAYLDKLASKLLQALLVNVRNLDPLLAAEVVEEDRDRATALLDSLIADMRAAGDIEEGIDVSPLKSRVLLEATELGPLSDLMADETVRDIQVPGGGPIKVLREGQQEGSVEHVERRFSGDKAVILAAQRLARQWGFLVEGAQVLEGKASHGFYMYALLPPTPVRNPVLSLRRTKTDANTLAALVAEGVLSNDMREVFAAAMKGNRNLLVCASGGVNLDRFMQALIGEVPQDKRVACISDTGRLGASHGGWIQVRRIADPADTVSLSDSLGVLLRGGLDLLVSQRCRHEDAAAVIDAISGATGGAVVSLWGIDSAHALSRLAALSTVASGAIHALTVALARSVDLLIRVGRGVNEEAMQVIEVVEPRVREGGEIVHMPIFRAMKAADGTTQFHPTGTMPAFVNQVAERGINVPKSIFKP